MNNFSAQLEEFGVISMNAEDMQQVEGGLFPIVVLGVVITAEAAGWIAAGTVAAGLFGAGVYVGYTTAK
ncbi:hypothetical protein FY528_07500 [Hymenobacter lutimineralis]|uniref:Class IIb bacteriocin, lactobin A/cerein 7B family n=1 Tax=Hymenobacter lutimineralis TaxID=2606448 RepID=A0A5D6V6U0_9BACT|nr:MULTISPECIES: hypothetical protein [Hymenobacter]QIX62962.1 hypothetical protein HER32_18010 [Hymenobacter sp. BT18]TYZ10895.1 hypothetical protein FY528_07500 [Hymenobacter lutimineralis]